MDIKIAERFRPYSHLPGTYFVLPLTTLRLQFFPSRINIDSIAGSTPSHLGSLSLPIQGPVEDFTIQQDLEKGCLRVWGKALNDFFRYRIEALNGVVGFAFHVEKAPSQTESSIHIAGSWKLAGEAQFNPGNRIVIGSDPHVSTQDGCLNLPIERLSLGNNKAQDWELIRRRLDFTEIFPLWYRLGNLVHELPMTTEGTARLMQECKEIIERNHPEFILASFRKLFLAGFDLGLSPRLQDTDFNGIAVPEIRSEASPLLLLSFAGMQLIRSLFVKESHGEISLLPALPPEFHCGRIHTVPFGGRLDIEWTKKAARRVVFQATYTQQLRFNFCRGEVSCRLRTSNKDRGIVYKNGSPIDIVAGQVYWLDNFVC